MLGMERWPGTPDRKRLGPEGRVPEPAQKAVYFFLAQREEVTCLMSHSREVTEPGF